MMRREGPVRFPALEMLGRGARAVGAGLSTNALELGRRTPGAGVRPFDALRSPALVTGAPPEARIGGAQRGIVEGFRPIARRRMGPPHEASVRRLPAR